MLSARLAAIAAYIPVCARLCDVGSDHAYLPIQLIKTGAVASAIASDISVPCIARARDNAARYGVEDILDVRLSDGLREISPDECDTVTISGMGAETIAAILDASPWVLEGRHLLILQPASKAPYLRRYLHERGFAIADETVVRDAGRLYPVIRAVKSAESTPWREVYAYASPALLKGIANPEIAAYIARTADLLSRERGCDMGIVEELITASKGK